MLERSRDVSICIGEESRLPVGIARGGAGAYYLTVISGILGGAGPAVGDIQLEAGGNRGRA